MILADIERIYNLTFTSHAPPYTPPAGPRTEIFQALDAVVWRDAATISSAVGCSSDRARYWLRKLVDEGVAVYNDERSATGGARRFWRRREGLH